MINHRKEDHLRIALECADAERERQTFDSVHLRHRALPEMDANETDSSTLFLGRKISCPLMISSITGGSSQSIIAINRHLAEAAEQEKIALAVGSQRIMFSEPASEASFQLRRHAPSVPLIANLGAVQLNTGMGLDECRKAVEVLGADALYLHLNPLQEMIQPEGDTCFAGLLEKIAAITGKLNVPVLIKEVGCGICLEDAELLHEAGVRIIDVAGRGGTNWSLIEAKRNKFTELGEAFGDWGIPTVENLKMLAPMRNKVALIASGGIRNGIDMAKAMTLGAALCGAALPFVEPAMRTTGAVCDVIRQMRREFNTTLFLLGVRHATDLIGNHSLILN